MHFLHALQTRIAAPRPRAALCAGAMAVVSMTCAATAQPVELKLSFFASDRIPTYVAGIKPFVDAINAEGKGLLVIKPYPDGALGSTVAEQPQLVIDGKADIAFVVPGQTPYRFPDNLLLEMPGLFRNAREGTLAYTRLLAEGALRGYQDFFVIGAFSTDPTIIHSRKPIPSLDALRGLKIRTNNPVEAETMEHLGAIPTVMPATMLADALAKGTVDGAIMSPAAIFQFGAAKAATHHYVLGVGSAPLVLLMSRKKFDSLPAPARALIQKYSGEGAAAGWIASFGLSDRESLEKIKSDSARKVVEPSSADAEAARQVYRSVIDSWAAQTPRNRELLQRLEAQLATIRSTK